jgi:hypothetical protein
MPALDPTEVVTISTPLDQWIAHGETRGRSPNTLHGYRSKATRIKANALGDVESQSSQLGTWTAGMSWPAECRPPR